MKKLLLFLFCIPFLGITQNSHTINTAGSTFSPSSLTINVGDTVNWNNTAGYHNVNATQATFPNNPETRWHIQRRDASGVQHGCGHGSNVCSRTGQRGFSRSPRYMGPG